MRIPKCNHSYTVHCQRRRWPDGSRRLLRGGPILFQRGAGDIFLSPAPSLTSHPLARDQSLYPHRGSTLPALNSRTCHYWAPSFPALSQPCSSQTSPLSTTPHSSPHTRPLLSPPPCPRSFPLLAKPHPSFNTKQKSPPTQSLL